MIKRIVRPDGSPGPGGAYSHVVVANGFVFVAGQGPSKPDSNDIPADFEAQVTQALRNVEIALRSVGCDLTHIVKVNAYLKDLNMFQKYNEIYAHIMPRDLPARTTIASNLIGMDVEIDCIAVLQSAPT